jgi:hypothetical protein
MSSYLEKTIFGVGVVYLQSDVETLGCNDMFLAQLVGVVVAGRKKKE